MANLPVVYTENDRHQCLMDIAAKVQRQVNENPPHVPDGHPEDPLIQVPHVVSSGK